MQYNEQRLLNLARIVVQCEGNLMWSILLGCSTSLLPTNSTCHAVSCAISSLTPKNEPKVEKSLMSPEPYSLKRGHQVYFLVKLAWKSLKFFHFNTTVETTT